MHACGQHETKCLKCGRSPFIVAQIRANAREYKAEGFAGLLDDGQPLYEGSQVGRGWVEGYQDQVCDGKQVSVYGTKGRGRVNEQILGSRGGQGADSGFKVGQGEGE